MKKILSLLSVLLLTFGCYDDSDIRSELREHEARLTTLETLCQQANSNIEALQTAVSALEKNVYVSAIVPVKKNGEVIGYAISFTNAETITIYHGKDGDKGEQGEKGNDGATPAVGLKQDADGTYYWTLNGEWLLDDSGKKVPASGKDGADGLPGASGPQGAAGKDGVTPHLKIEEGYWYVSYDGGKTWEDEPLGAAGASDDEPIFTEVTYDTDYVYLTLADGEKLTLPRKTGETGDESTNPAIVTLAEITASTVTFTGHLDIPASDLPFSKVTVYYSDAAAFNVNTAESESAITFDSEQNFTIILKNLRYSTKYNYCVVADVKSEGIYGEVLNFTTNGIDRSTIDLSSSATANCYIVSKTGAYKFKSSKGNSSVSVGKLASVEVLWESFGTAETPAVGDLIGDICYNDTYIAFKTADSFKEGNAVIAAKDASGNILWSWHIWLTDQPQGLVYYNGAGTMMDRNLGATSATPEDVGALGLLYQRGRKDPFLGSSSISSNTVAQSTISWPYPVSSDSSCGTIAYATAHPITFISYNSGNYDWYYTGDSTTDNSRWTTSDKEKSIYDPCPVGWRVPDGGDDGVWSKALGSSSHYEGTYNSTNKGMNFSGKFGNASTIWYPASGHRQYDGGSLYNAGGSYWSASPSSNVAHTLGFGDSGYVSPSSSANRAAGRSVRCLQE